MGTSAELDRLFSKDPIMNWRQSKEKNLIKWQTIHIGKDEIDGNEKYMPWSFNGAASANSENLWIRPPQETSNMQHFCI